MQLTEIEKHDWAEELAAKTKKDRGTHAAELKKEWTEAEAVIWLREVRPLMLFWARQARDMLAASGRPNTDPLLRASMGTAGNMALICAGHRVEVLDILRAKFPNISIGAVGPPTYYSQLRDLGEVDIPTGDEEAVYGWAEDLTRDARLDASLNTGIRHRARTVPAVEAERLRLHFLNEALYWAGQADSAYALANRVGVPQGLRARLRVAGNGALGSAGMRISAAEVVAV